MINTPQDPFLPRQTPTQTSTQTSTQTPTQAPTQAPTQMPAQMPTQVPAQMSTQAPREPRTPRRISLLEDFPILTDEVPPSDTASDETFAVETAGTTDLSSPALDAQGALVVQVFTAREALPLEGCSVALQYHDTDGNKLLRFLLTDRAGRTSPVTLPAPDSSLTLSPANPHPFATYFVTVTRVGFSPLRDAPTLVFGGELSLLPVELLPLPAPSSDLLTVTSAPPTV